MLTGMRVIRRIVSRCCLGAMSQARRARIGSPPGKHDTWWLATSMCIAFVGVLGACGEPEPNSAGITNPPDARSDYGDYGETECPPDVSPADCQPMTDAERGMIADDLNLYVKWEFADCRRVGQKMMDFVLTGDMRKFPEYSTWWGWWQSSNYPTSGSPQQISFERSQLQGWAQQSRRVRTAIHEGVHLDLQSGDPAELTAMEFEEYCINW